MRFVEYDIATTPFHEVREQALEWAVSNLAPGSHVHLMDEDPRAEAPAFWNALRERFSEWPDLQVDNALVIVTDDELSEISRLPQADLRPVKVLESWAIGQDGVEPIQR